MTDPISDKEHDDLPPDVRTLLAVERNHLAAERTFLSWIRTGLAGVGGGFALIRVFEFNTYYHQLTAYVVGLMLLLWGISLFVIAFSEYEKSYARLKQIDPSLEVPIIRRRLSLFMLLVLSFMLVLLVI